jgi:hypothetical protein
VPLWIEMEHRSIVQGTWPGGAWRGAYTVRIGKPLTFEPGTSAVEATDRIRAAVLQLSGSEKAR